MAITLELPWRESTSKLKSTPEPEPYYPSLAIKDAWGAIGCNKTTGDSDRVGTRCCCRGTQFPTLK